jgi:acyl dehydratase
MWRHIVAPASDGSRQGGQCHTEHSHNHHAGIGPAGLSVMVTQLSKPADLLGMVGQDIGTGQWHAITQHQVNIFADATHDHQWIHVEPECAAKNPYGGPIAHGYLTLSFCPVFLDDVLKIDAVTAAVNYGVNRVRFPAPVPAGSRIRGHVRLVSAKSKESGLECTFGILVEREGSDRPACVIETVVIYR